MKRILSILLVLFLCMRTFGQEPPEDLLLRAANNFITEYFPDNGYTVSGLRPIMSGSFKTMFEIDLEPYGWMLLSADQGAEPLLGFSFTGKFRDPENRPGNSNYFWFNQYSDQIKEIAAAKSPVIHPSWERITDKSYHSKGSNADVRVANLIEVEWDQDAGWNQFCPVDSDGPGDHVYVGCVAVSMAQAMSAYKKPVTGNSTHSYFASGYGTQFADYGSTTYKWDSMGIASPDEYNSLLLYHTAVSVDMNFGPDASGALISDASSAFKKYFVFSKQITVEYRPANDQEWINTLNSELENGRPIIYAGDADDGNPGHAFNIDGVINTYYHVNWGWNGTNNGYYTINSLKPGGQDFTKNHRAILGIRPYYYPTGIVLSDTVVPLNTAAGAVVGIISVVDEATDNTYAIAVFPDSVFNGTGYTKDYYLEGDSLKTGRVFSLADGITDTVRLTVADVHGNFIERRIALLIGTPSTGINDAFTEAEDIPVLYPNPSSGLLYLKQDQLPGTASVKIYSIGGTVMRRFSGLQNGSAITLNGLFPGIYIYEVEQSEGKIKRGKLIIR